MEGEKVYIALKQRGNPKSFLALGFGSSNMMNPWMLTLYIFPCSVWFNFYIWNSGDQARIFSGSSV